MTKKDKTPEKQIAQGILTGFIQIIVLLLVVYIGVMILNIIAVGCHKPEKEHVKYRSLQQEYIQCQKRQGEVFEKFFTFSVLK